MSSSLVRRYSARPRIALLTDFGTRDWYAAALKGVLLSCCPSAQLVDVTHEIPPQDVVAGAVVLAAAAPWFPAETIFVVVVDPGVGTRRAIVAVKADQHYVIGPDNGVLSLMVQRARRWQAVRLANRRPWLSPVSRTFQGRDIMAPVAAWLAQGGRLSQLGPRMRRLVPLDLPAPRRRGRHATGCVIYIDGYGTLVTNLPGAWVRSRRRTALVRVRCQAQEARVVSSYGDGRPGELLALVGSLGVVELAVREGSAANICHAQRGDDVTVVGR